MAPCLDRGKETLHFFGWRYEDGKRHSSVSHRIQDSHVGHPILSPPSSTSVELHLLSAMAPSTHVARIPPPSPGLPISPRARLPLELRICSELRPFHLHAELSRRRGTAPHAELAVAKQLLHAERRLCTKLAAASAPPLAPRSSNAAPPISICGEQCCQSGMARFDRFCGTEPSRNGTAPSPCS